MAKLTATAALNHLVENGVAINGVEVEVAWDDVTGKPPTFAPTIGSGATQAVAGNDPRLTNARTPTAHDQAATTVTVADGDDGLDEGNLQAVLQALASRIAVLEDQD